MNFKFMGSISPAPNGVPPAEIFFDFRDPDLVSSRAPVFYIVVPLFLVRRGKLRYEDIGELSELLEKTSASEVLLMLEGVSSDAEYTDKAEQLLKYFPDATIGISVVSWHQLLFIPQMRLGTTAVLDLDALFNDGIDLSYHSQVCMFGEHLTTILEGVGHCKGFVCRAELPGEMVEALQGITEYGFLNDWEAYHK